MGTRARQTPPPFADEIYTMLTIDAAVRPYDPKFTRAQRSAAASVPRLFRKWLDAWHCVTPGRIVTVQAAVVMLGLARIEIYGIDEWPAVRAQCIDLLARMHGEAVRIRAEDSHANSGRIDTESGIYTESGIRQTGAGVPDFPAMPTATQDTMTFGEGLAAVRRARGLTQQQLAEQVNVSQGRVSLWEDNKQAPRLGHHQALIRVLRPRNNDFTTGEPA